jgi:transcriptional regulator with PAS, ATPase and Fis domain
MSSDNRSLSIMHLTLKECALIMDNCFTGLFVTDGTGRIIYVNHDTLDTLGVSASEVLGMDVYQLNALGFTSYSSTAEVLERKKRVFGTYTSKTGNRVAVVSTPVFDEHHTISMVVTYSQEVTSLEGFQDELNRINRKLKNYKATLNYMGTSGKQTLIAEDPAMQYIFQMLDSVAETDSTIMIYGESGVGKEIIANYIYQHSLRRDEIFMPINCATIPESLIDSELYGYESGTFTGANRGGKEGLFELANGGTIFMDEIGELPLSAQTKLLRVLETGEFRRIGGKTIQKTNVRVIGATNRDLKEMIAAKKFRADLYYRLNIIPVNVPPLRSRPLDLDAFIDLFLSGFNRKHGRERSISNEIRDVMHQYSWPGNIRELRNIIEQYVLTGQESVFSFRRQDMLHSKAHDISFLSADTAARSISPDAHTLKEVTRHFQYEYIRNVLKQCGGNVSKAAKQLGISRAAFYDKLKNYTELS